MKKFFVLLPMIGVVTSIIMFLVYNQIAVIQCVTLSSSVAMMLTILAIHENCSELVITERVVGSGGLIYLISSPLIDGIFHHLFYVMFIFIGSYLGYCMGILYQKKLI